MDHPTRRGPTYMVTVMRLVPPFVFTEVPTGYLQEASFEFEQFNCNC